MEEEEEEEGEAKHSRGAGDHREVVYENKRWTTGLRNWSRLQAASR
jgi:hypothetical protein